MDIKIKDTKRAGILAYDLDDCNARNEMQLAVNVNKVKFALQEYSTVLRNIRKYDAITDLSTNEVALTPKLKKEIIAAEEYYRLLLVQILNEYELLGLLNG